MKITTDMIKVKKEFVGRNVNIRNRPKFTLGDEVDYSTAFAMNEAGLGKMLIKEKVQKDGKPEKKKAATKKPAAKNYKGIDEATPTAEKAAEEKPTTEAEAKGLETDRGDSLHTT